MLEVGELGAGFGGGGFARVEDFGAQLGAGGAEEVGFLRVGRISGLECLCMRGGRDVRFRRPICLLVLPLRRRGLRLGNPARPS